MVRDEQHHTQEHHQNPTLEHTSSSHIRFVFSHVVHFSLQTIWQYFSLFPSISLPSPPQACHVPQEPAEHHKGFSVCPPKPCSDLQAERHLLSQQRCPARSLTGEPPMLGLTQGLGSSGFASSCSRCCLSLWTPVRRSGCS